MTPFNENGEQGFPLHLTDEKSFSDINRRTPVGYAYNFGTTCFSASFENSAMTATKIESSRHTVSNLLKVVSPKSLKIGHKAVRSFRRDSGKWDLSPSVEFSIWRMTNRQRWTFGHYFGERMFEMILLGHTGFFKFLGNEQNLSKAVPFSNFWEEWENEYLSISFDQVQSHPEWSVLWTWIRTAF